MVVVTDALPIVVFAKQLEDMSRKIMEIMECEILPNGERRYNTLYHFKIEENQLVAGKYRISGCHEAVNPISEGLQKRLVENGMPIELLGQLEVAKPQFPAAEQDKKAKSAEEGGAST